MDDTYQTYLNRVTRLTLTATYQSQLLNIQESPKFKRLPNGSREPAPFPGYTVITPPWEEETNNSTFYDNMQQLQKELLQQLDPGLMVPIPPDSFHLTLADLIWENAYRDATAENPQFETQLLKSIQASFDKSVSISQETSLANGGNPISWQLLGLMVMPRAIGVCLAPQDEQAYNRISQLRRCIYQNSDLMALGIEQQYHFTAHITLGYFGDIPQELDSDRISNILFELSGQALEVEGSVLSIRQAQLRKFDDMMRFLREPEWPVLEF
ncbi:MAG: DUF1868 domain-containing protein [Moorea sp. SIO1F2]|uniref:DUF1868 domain-containing protein n=1 Tax=unclassified Moorena TaxID=2683338 RepID=UPI0013BB7CD8|nr:MULTISPECIES: DUF1868 domain-containing protein [unclassified Moorena]NEO07635.1 DUF1868 domain-containing protein [Moorena sp. SIO3I8]NEO15278.1 DUF1868 domain-containing protein [Moorena sp. SIO3E8]NEO19637.1 DUF1868 domain-containing protein [Moorena sp. SIO4A5]NEQ01613.1 DUF1868 domain-containing protein [Moorena sp. SIO3F7]NEQ59834.1 DUF1868 domain-containing protein [Moorena sp. SIO4A1]